MSTGGHRHEPDESSITELHHALSHPGVQEYLKRPFTVDFEHHIPLTGGSNTDGSVYYGDHHLPKSFRTHVIIHERVEKALRSALGMGYDHAHVLATAAEKLSVIKSGGKWAAYKKGVAKPVRRDEKEPKRDVPHDLDQGPVQAEAKDLRKAS